MNVSTLDLVGARVVCDMQASPHGEQSIHESLERSAKSNFSNQQHQCPEQQQGTPTAEVAKGPMRLRAIFRFALLCLPIAIIAINPQVHSCFVVTHRFHSH
jgi:hypothetical protein